MANAVLFLGWNRPHVGLEDQAFQYLTGEGMTYLRSCERKYYERAEIIGLTPHGGDLNGCIILFGERPRLDELRRTDDFERFSMRLSELFDRVGVIPGVNWEGIQAVMARRAAQRK
jgi:hypothetical protein